MSSPLLRVAPVPGCCFAWVLIALAPACRRDEGTPGSDGGAAAFVAAGSSSPVVQWTAQDWTTLRDKVRWGVERGLDTLPVGQAIARLAETFIGSTYTPHTLEVPGPERVVVNLREFDCVTLIENVLSLVRFIRRDGAPLLDDPPAAQAQYEAYLKDLRYREGVVDGYASRLHYFSEWLADNQGRGRLRILSRELGASRDAEPIDFMTAHPESYRQLGDPGVREAMGDVEARLNAGGGRWFVPEGQIAGVAARIQDGDLIAATSTVRGLDVAHTGIAVWREGRLHLLHAPLVGKVVEISARPLADRIKAIPSQDGIMVARVVEP